MLFYPTRRINAPSTRRGTSRPWPTAESDDAQRVAWILKSFAMGVTLLGLSYWLVQIAGVQYLASLTSATLLAFLLGYVVWCLLHRNRLTRQRSDAATRTEAGHATPVVGSTVPPIPTPPPPFENHQTYKYVTRAPGRDLSPPPTYEEAIRSMMSTTICTPGLTYHHSVSLDTGPRPSQLEESANMASPVASASVPTINASPTQLSPSALTSPPPSSLMPSPQTALTFSISSPSALIPDAASVVQTASAATQQASGLTCPCQSGVIPQPSTALKQTSPTALISSSMTPLTPSEHPPPHVEEVS
ncbi:hypothetical protein Cfor_12921 [Coptotermes formosanus]|uniref:Uncharacterized protein n=1 Tax=Coptotermes formosanus TaxID=36987 RepID=A0A6L2PJI9_COPFO|nr:hypothetical protein Cfor_12921 [Coptotermes formosanus]